MPHCAGHPGNVVWAEGTPTLTLLGSVGTLLGGAPQRCTRSLPTAWDYQRCETDRRLRHTAPLSYARDHRGAPLSTARIWQQPYQHRTQEAESLRLRHRASDSRLPAQQQPSRYTTTRRCSSLVGGQDAARRQTTDTQTSRNRESAHQKVERRQGHPLLWEAHRGGQEAGVRKDAMRTRRRCNGAAQVALEATVARSPTTWRREGRAFACSASRVSAMRTDNMRIWYPQHNPGVKRAWRE
jgi:hypothetical protein